MENVKPKLVDIEHYKKLLKKNNKNKIELDGICNFFKDYYSVIIIVILLILLLYFRYQDVKEKQKDYTDRHLK